MSIAKEGFLKVKLHHQVKWHRRYCTVDWDKSILFIASKADTRYRDWIKLLPNTVINDYEYSSTCEANNSSLNNIIEIRTENGTEINLLQIETKKDYDSWILALKRTAFSRIGGGIFGQSLEDTYKYSYDKSSLVPIIVRQCCEYLLEHGPTFVGLFRIPGKQSSIKELRDLYDRGLSIELKPSYSPATISSLLKIYLQSLPEPIIPAKNFDDFLEIGSRLKYNQTNDLDSLKQLIETNLSTINYAILAYLCLFLKKLTDHVQNTKMDTDNLAVVFGNNLIRPGEELDLNMIKGHSYNLLPLIKVLIDHSEYLFPNNSVNQYQDSFEQTTESVTKSSGFSSFSSLLSAHENPLTKNSRSTSMPSIYMAATSSSYDSENCSLESQSELNKLKQRPELSIENQTDVVFDQSSYPSSSFEKKSNIRQRFPSSDLIDDNQTQERIKHNPRSMDNMSLEQNCKSDNQPRPVAIIGGPMSVNKMEKYPKGKNFANKFGKSFFSLKSSMTKALQSHGSSNNTESQIIDLTNNQEFERKPLDSSQSNNSLKRLQNDIDILKKLLNQKDLLLLELTNNSRDERLQYEKEKFQLNQKIEQLQNENFKLQKQLNMQ